MPNWGLTPAMREAEPWDIPRHLLEPGKTITDPVHGDIYLTALEGAVIDSRPFQRLRRIKQLGNTHLVYPGATHSRFSHALGALRVAQDLLDKALDHRLEGDACPDLFGQWERELAPDGEALKDDEAREFHCRVGQAIVLTRLGALLHDLCHVPFGHSVEDDLSLLVAHDQNPERFQRLWTQMPRRVKTTINGELLRNLTALILTKHERGERDGEEQLKYPFVEDIVGNTICADLLDYLRRDHLYTGLPLALGRRFESGFYVQPVGDPQFSSRLVLRVVRDGRERTDVITEILKHLRYRYELSERVLTHHAKVGADAMVGKALEMWRDALVVEGARSALKRPAANVTDPQELLALLKDHDPKAAKEVKNDAKEQFDSQLLRRGDDGLLEFLRDLPEEPAPSGTEFDVSRRRAVQRLALDLLDRQLYKRIAYQPHIRQSREEFCERYRRPEVRRRIEEAAARYAGLDPAWHVAVWVPPADMRLKVADVLVDDGREVRHFVDRERDLRKRGAEIPEAHEQLWAVSVYVHDSVKNSQRELLLASLSADLDMALEPASGVPTELSVCPPYEWPDRIAIRPLKKKHKLSDSQVTDLMARRHARAARGKSDERPSRDALTAEYEQLLD